MKLVLSLATICLIFSLLSAAEAALNLQLFSQEESHIYGAKCLDGSPAGYYFEPSVNSNGSRKWVFYLGSGGFCFNDCSHRLHTEHGSSKYWKKTTTYEGLTTPSEKRNPFTWNWNHIHIPYCSGDYWSGQVTEPSDASGGLIFAGHVILNATIQKLKQTAGLELATDVLISGGSAGGYGVFVNVDFFAEMIPNAKVVGVPQGGLFLRTMDFPTWMFAAGLLNTQTENSQQQQREHKKRLLTAASNGRGQLQSFFPHSDAANCFAMNRTSMFEKYGAYVNPKCARAVPKEDLHLCFEPTFMNYFITSPIFIVENLYDTDQIFILGSAPSPDPPYQPPFSLYLDAYLTYFGRCMHHAVERAMLAPVSNRGLFVPACLGHLTKNNYGQPFVQGRSMMDALGAWINSDHQTASFVDELGIGEYNPTCNRPDNMPADRQKQKEREDARIVEEENEGVRAKKKAQKTRGKTVH